MTTALPVSSGEKGPVVVGYVGGAGCSAALLWAAAAAAEAGVALRIVHAFRSNARTDAPGSYVRGHAAARRAAEARVGNAVAIVRRAHPDLAIAVVTAAGRPSAVLRRAAEGGSMLVVSTRRQSYALQWLGSVTNRVTGSVSCPVVSLPGAVPR